MQIDAIAEMDLTPTQEARIGALLDAGFGAEAGYFGRSFHKQRHHLRLLAHAGGALVGHVALLFRVIAMGDRATPIIGLAEVATDPAHRGKGIATALLTAAISRARTSQAEFILLFGDRPIYQGFGFQPKTCKIRYMGMADGQATRICTRVEPATRVFPLQKTAWDDGALIDLAGPIF
jgi:predicted N-acetyltransferase YhbS